MEKRLRRVEGVCWRGGAIQTVLTARFRFPGWKFEYMETMEVLGKGAKGNADKQTRIHRRGLVRSTDSKVVLFFHMIHALHAYAY